MSSDGYHEMFPAHWDARSTIDWKHSGMTKNVWNTRLYKITPQPHPQERSVECGNSKKAKEIVALFSQTSSLHGAAIVCSSRHTSRCTRIFYKILLFSCFLLVTLSLASLLEEVLSTESVFINTINKETSSGFEEDPAHFPRYPRVTICRNPSYRTDFNESYLKLVEYALMSLGYPFSSLTAQEVTMVVELASVGPDEDLSDRPRLDAYRRHVMRLEDEYQEMKRSDERFDLKQFIVGNSVRCTDFFSSCMAMVSEVNCCDLFKPVLTSLGLCYSMRRSEVILEMEEIHQLAFTLIIDLISPPHLNKPIEEGFHVFFSDPDAEFFIGEAFNGEKVLPGMVTVISVVLEKWNRNALHTPWHDLFTTCPTFPFQRRLNRSDPERYDMIQCIMHFIFQKNRVDCGCAPLLDDNDPLLERCDPSEVYGCLIRAVLKRNFTDLHQLCHEPCVSYRYRTDASYMGFGAVNHTRIEIQYNSKNFIYHQYRKSTLSSVISQIGGSLGLYLGASIITVVELTVFFLSWMWHKFVPARSRVQPSTGYSGATTTRGVKKRTKMYH